MSWIKEVFLFYIKIGEGGDLFTEKSLLYLVRRIRLMGGEHWFVPELLP